MSTFSVMPITTVFFIITAICLTVVRYWQYAQLTEAQFAIKFWWLYLSWFALGAIELLLREAWSKVRRK